MLMALCAPLPWGVRKNVSRWLYRVKAQERLLSLIKYIIFALFIALAESVNSIRNAHIQSQKDKENYVVHDPSYLTPATDYRWQKVRGERNFYLASFSIVALIAIGRLVSLAGIEVQLRNRIKSFNGNRPISETGETLSEPGKDLSESYKTK